MKNFELYKENFVNSCFAIAKNLEEADEYLNKIDEVIGVSDAFIEEYFRGIRLAIDLLRDSTVLYFITTSGCTNDTEKKNIKLSIEEDLSYYFYEGGGSVSTTINSEYVEFKIEEPEDLWNMWCKLYIK